MEVPFPHTPTRAEHGRARGFPVRAKSCGCGPQSLLDHEGLCIRCGYWPAETVELTWREQARRTEERPVGDLDRKRAELYSKAFRDPPLLRRGSQRV